jgi:hypothetical protein
VRANALPPHPLGNPKEPYVKRYEYLQESIPWSNPQYRAKNSEQITKDILNKFGAEGWHPIYIHRETQGYDTSFDVILEREIPEASVDQDAVVSTIKMTVPVRPPKFTATLEDVEVSSIEEARAVAHAAIDEVADDAEPELVTYKMAANVIGLTPQRFTYLLKKRDLRDADDFPFSKVADPATNRERWVASPDDFVLWVRERFPEELAFQRKEADNSEE